MQTHAWTKLCVLLDEMGYVSTNFFRFNMQRKTVPLFLLCSKKVLHVAGANVHYWSSQPCTMLLGKECKELLFSMKNMGHVHIYMHVCTFFKSRKVDFLNNTTYLAVALPYTYWIQ